MSAFFILFHQSMAVVSRQQPPRHQQNREHCGDDQTLGGLKWNAIRLPNDCLIQGIMSIYKLQVGMPDVWKFTCFFLSVSKRIHATYIPTRYREWQWRQMANMAYMDDMYIKQVDLIISVTYWSPWGLCIPSSNPRRSIKMFTYVHLAWGLYRNKINLNISIWDTIYTYIYNIYTILLYHHVLILYNKLSHLSLSYQKQPISKGLYGILSLGPHPNNLENKREIADPSAHVLHGFYLNVCMSYVYTF